MIESIKKFVQTNKLISKDNKTIYAAVSGGMDSCVLLHVLYDIRVEFGFKLKVVHFNHRTRAGESDADQKFVEQLAARYDLPINVGIISPRIHKKTETVLREERYRFFSKIISSDPDSLIATGHHRDDNVETFFMRLLKGSRLNGLMAIPVKRGGYIRPFLSTTRREIKSYARRNAIDYREDVSNEDQAILRNQMRHTVLPFLRQEVDRHLDENISRIIRDISFYYNIYEEKFKEARTTTVKKSSARVYLNRKRYQAFNPVIQRGLIEYCISSLYKLNYKISDRNFLIWDTFISTAKPGKKNAFLESGIAIAERAHIVFGEEPENNDETYRLEIGKSVTVGDNYTIRYSEIKSGEIKFSKDRHTEVIDGYLAGKVLQVRFWQDGDRFNPLGMRHRRKLSDFFVDLKLNISAKKEIPLVCNKDQIIWIAGLRLDDNFKVTDETKLFYKLELIRGG